MRRVLWSPTGRVSCTVATSSEATAPVTATAAAKAVAAAASPAAVVHNTIIAGNLADGSGPDCIGALASSGYNLIEDTSDCTITGDLAGNIVGADPRLGPLQNNGGATDTHALLAGSPAIDAGDPNGCTDATGALLTTDQRGAPRSSGSDPRCDIGAFEFGAIPAPFVCVGDCDRVGGVTVDELVLGVNIALGNAPVDACPAFDADDDGHVDVTELMRGVGNALDGCP